jgi:hypothetical protein
MIEYLLRAICGCFIKGMNAFWNTKYKNKKFVICYLWYLFVVR